jgi:hypothetical protein
MARSGEGALGQLIQAQNQANIARRAGAIPILSTLLRENQPYTKTRKKTGFFEKAAPYIKLSGSLMSSATGGQYGKETEEFGTDLAEVGGATDKPPTTFGSTGGEIPQQTGAPATTQTQTPVTQNIPQQSVAQGGGPSVSSAQGNKMGGMMKNKGGIMQLMKMFQQFGGSFGGGKGGGFGGFGGGGGGGG